MALLVRWQLYGLFCYKARFGSNQNNLIEYYENKNCCWIIDQSNFDQLKFDDLLLDILKNSDDFIIKKNNLENLNYQNTWNNVNQNLLKIINEN